MTDTPSKIVKWEEVPKTSLGPKPTKLQMELLKKMAEPGVKVHWWSGIRSADGASIVWPQVDEHTSGKRETLRTDVLYKFSKWGWLVAVGDPGWAWRNNEYVITDTGRKRIEMGETR